MNAEQVLWQLVKLFAAHEDPTLKTKVGRLAKTLVEYQPEFHSLLCTRKKALEQAVQGKHNKGPIFPSFLYLSLSKSAANFYIVHKQHDNK